MTLRTHRANRWRRGDDGSVLMLVPAGLLVLFILGAIAVDSAVVFLAARDLSNRTAAVANDAAAAAIDDAAFYETNGTVTLDPRRAETYVALAFDDERRPAGYRSWDGQAVTSGRFVTVVAAAEVDHIFARAIPGVARSTTVRARSVASVRGG